MGYRSDVVIGTAKSMYGKLLLDPKYSEARAFINEAAEVTEKGNSVYLQFYCIKWYPEFGEISAIELWLSELDASEESLYGFIRMGEDLDDVEERGDPFTFGIYLRREIAVDR